MKSILRILSSTKELKGFYTGIIICSILVSVTTLVTPFVIKEATDSIVAHLDGSQPTTTSKLVYLALAYLLLQVARAFLTNVGGYWGDVMSQKMRTILSTRYFAKLLVLPQSYYEKELTGTIVSRLNRSITELANFVKMFSNNFFTLIMNTVAIIIIAGIYYWPLAVLLIIVFPVYFWLTSQTSIKWQVWEGEKNQNIDTASGRFNESIGQIRVVKSFGQERHELNLFSKLFNKTIGLTSAQSRFWHMMDFYRLGFLALIFFVIYMLIFIRTLNGQFSLGDMVLLIQMVNMATQPIQSLSWVVDTAQRAIAGSKDYFEAMDHPVDPRSLEIMESENQPVEDTPLKTAIGLEMVAFKDVTFGYEAEEDVLKGINFSVTRGEKIAFVGESGGGKSTIMALLEGLYNPRKGQVLVDGADVATSSLRNLRAKIGMVFQDASLFSGTIAENIAYGRPDATHEQIEAAAIKANAHEFISKFHDGYDTTIGERGIKLSGGQKQRIAVARAILKDAPILILDEATSALDTKAERAVQRGLDELMVGRTSLIIAHRLSTISAVDRIVTIRDGAIDEIGTPAELANSGGIYAQLLELQNEGSKKSKKQLKNYDIVG